MILIFLFLMVAFAVALGLGSPLAIILLIVAGIGVDLGWQLARWRRRDILWVEGHCDIGPGKARAERSASEIRKAYRMAGLRKPIILNVPQDTTIRRHPHN